MNGPHDLGGADGFGPVPYSPAEPAFHEAWEGRMFALAGAAMMSGAFGTPEFRHAMERIDPKRYASLGYFERWNIGVTTLLMEKGIFTREEIGSSFPFSAPARRDRSGTPGADVLSPAFAEGDEVRVRNEHPHGHTRCPRYVRGRRGRIVAGYGSCNFDDAEAQTEGERLDPLYCVRFEAAELWGSSAEPGAAVHVDLFETYLEAV